MKAYGILVSLYEGEQKVKGEVWIITIASCIELASQFARQAVTESDETTPGFFWRVVKAEEIEGKVAIPAMKQILPRMDD